MTESNDGLLHTGIDTAQEKAHDLIDNSALDQQSKASLHKANQAASSAAHDATDAAGSAIGAVRSAASQVANRISDEYGKRPLSVLAISVGLLALVGTIAMLSKRRD